MRTAQPVILAGHEVKDLSPTKTLKSIYLDPIFRMLEKANESEQPPDSCADSCVDSSTRPVKSPLETVDHRWHGIFELAPKQELMLMIDMVRQRQLVCSPAVIYSSHRSKREHSGVDARIGLGPRTSLTESRKATANLCLTLWRRCWNLSLQKTG